MPDLDSALRQRAREISAAEARQALERQQAAAVQLMAEAGRLEKLAANEEVRWFLETYRRPIVDAERKAALDIQRTAAERDNSAHRYDLGQTLLGLLATKVAESRSRAQQAAKHSQN